MIAREEMHLARAAVDYADAVFKYANMPEEKMEDHMMARLLCLYSAVQSVIQANAGARDAVTKLHLSIGPGAFWPPESYLLVVLLGDRPTGQTSARRTQSSRSRYEDLCRDQAGYVYQAGDVPRRSHR